MSEENVMAALAKVLENLDVDAAETKVIEQLRQSLQKPQLTSEKYSDAYFDEHASSYIDFTYKNPTVYHVVQHFSSVLEKANFKYVPESESWDNMKPGKYYTHRSGTALVAFVVGPDWTPSKGVGVIGSHVDSLTAILKPVSVKDPVDGYDLLGVAPYAGALSDVWWDRDLGVGGRLLVKDANGKVKQVLADSSPHPIAKIPTLAPHFGEPSVGPFNKETQAVPVIGFSGDKTVEPREAEKKAPLYGKHPLKLLRYVASLAKVNVEDILQWDLHLFDVQKGTRGGLENEFVFAPRVDDRVCSYAAISSIIESSNSGALSPEAFSIVGLFDNEEIGSATRQGIKGQFIESVIARVTASKHFNPDLSDIAQHLKVIYANTVILSADVNHLVNPNFTSAYLEHHKPVPNKGVTIALDPNGNMATDSVGLALVEELARLNGDELQYFQIRNGTRSGGTIGPSISLQTGARTVDLGIPQLSMHSIRATLGAKDIGLGVKFFNGFFTNWRKTYDNFEDL